MHGEAEGCSRPFEGARRMPKRGACEVVRLAQDQQSLAETPPDIWLLAEVAMGFVRRVRATAILDRTNANRLVHLFFAMLLHAHIWAIVF